MNLFKLVGSIFIDNEKANESLGKTDEKAGSVAQTLGKGIKTVAAWGAAIASAAVIAGTAIYSSATSAAAAADNIDKMSQKIGISREAYQELDFICSQSGMSVDLLQTGVKSLTAAMDGAREGTASNVEQFEKLGIAITNADGSFRSQEDVLFDTLAALQGVTDQTEKARLASELFGRSGTELMPLLNGQAGSIEEMKKQAHELGLVLDDELITNGVNLTDSLDQTKRAFQSIAVNIGGSFMPIIEKASDYIQNSLPMIQDMIKQFSPLLENMFSGILPLLTQLGESVFPVVLDFLNALIPELINIGSSIMPIIIQALNILLPAAVQIISTVLPSVLSLLSPLLDLLSPILSLLEPILSILITLLEPSIQMLQPLIELVAYLLEGLLPPLTELLTFIADLITTYVTPAITDSIASNMDFITMFVDQFKILIDGVVTFISGTINVIMGIIDVFIALFNGDFEAAGDALMQILSGLGNMIIGLLQAAFFNIIAMITNNLDGIGEFFTNFCSNISSFFSNLWNSSIEDAKAKLTFLKDSISNILEGAAGIVSGIVERMKGFFNFEFNVPKIKMPHFSVSPSGWKLADLLQGTIPQLGIEWYAKAMDNGMIMDRPTVFGVSGNRLLAGGEAGSETVVGTNSLVNMIQDAVDSRIGNGMGAVLDLLLQILKLLQTGSGDILIPVYVGGDLIDEKIIRAGEIHNLRTGGH